MSRSRNHRSESAAAPSSGAGATALALGFAYFAASLLGLEFTQVSGTSVVWPASGIALALFILTTRSWWIRLALAVLAAHTASLVIMGSPTLAAVGFGVVQVAEAALGAWLLRIGVGPVLTLSSPRQAVAYLVLVHVVATSLTSIGGAAIAVTAHGASFREAYWVWWVRSGLASLVLTPWIVLLVRRMEGARRPADPLRLLECGLLFACLTGLAIFVFGTAHEYRLLGHFAYLVLPLIGWAILRLDPFETSSATLVFAGSSFLTLLWDLGALAPQGEDAVRSLMELERFLSIIAGTTLIGASISHAHARAREALAGLNRDLAERIAESTEALRESEDRYRRLFELAPDPMLVHTGGRIVLGNPAALEFLGVEHLEELVGKPALDLVDPEDRARVASRIRTVLDEGESVPLEEQKLIAGGGRVVHAEVTGTRIRHDGEAGVLVSIRDVTERKLAEQHRDLLTRELDHRVKNTLATVLALLEESAVGSPNPEDFASALTGRIRSMARAHEVLAASHWEQARLDEILQRVLEVYSGASGRIEFDGPPVLLSARCAQPVALALNELATNAFKHGALSVPSGRVELSWRETGGTHLSLRWAEHGGPLIASAERHGVGLSLLRSLIEIDLGGRVAIEFEPSGIRCHLEWPLEEAPTSP